MEAGEASNVSIESALVLIGLLSGGVPGIVAVWWAKWPFFDSGPQNVCVPRRKVPSTAA